MNSRTTIGRLQRLELMTARLKSGDMLTIGNIAKEFGVSARTVTRDIELLRDQGLPINADRGRGGGVRLHWSWGIGRLSLNYTEAVDLLVSLAVAERIKSPLLIANLNSVRRKLVASFSPSMKHQINRLKSRIVVGDPASASVLSGFRAPIPQVVKNLHQAFLAMRKISIHYHDARGRVSNRMIEPQYLLYGYPVWYVLGWDELRSGERTFRCDRIKRVRLLDDEFRLRRLTHFERQMDNIDAHHP